MNAPHEIMRLARQRGQIDMAETHYDHQRAGRVLTLVVFFPGRAGYDEVPSGEGTTAECPACGSTDPAVREVDDILRPCTDAWHRGGTDQP